MAVRKTRRAALSLAVCLLTAALSCPALAGEPMGEPIEQPTRPPVTATPAPTPFPTLTPTPTPTPAPTPAPTASPTPSPTATAAPETAPPATPSPGPLTVTVLPQPGGSVTALDEGDAPRQAFLIRSEPGWRIRDVLVDGKSVGPVSKYVFSGMTGGHIVSALFEPSTGSVEEVDGRDLI